MSEAIKMRVSPEMGAIGIAIGSPTSQEDVSVNDVLEILRWMHEDLRRMEAEIRNGKTIKLLTPYRSQPEFHREILEILRRLQFSANRTLWSRLKDWVKST